MNKLFSSVSIIMTLCLASCSAPMPTSQSRQNNLDSAFTSEVNITLDKMTAQGNIKRLGDSEWEIEFTAPNTLSGVNITFSQGNVSASYQGLSFSVPKSALPVKAMLVNLIDAVDQNARSEELNGSENEGVFEISGTLESGDYILTIDSNGNIKSFDMPNNLLEMDFTEVQTIQITTTAETSSMIAETTAPTESSSQAED